jgi:hypothetical protein
MDFVLDRSTASVFTTDVMTDIIGARLNGTESDAHNKARRSKLTEKSDTFHNDGCSAELAVIPRSDSAFFQDTTRPLVQPWRDRHQQHKPEVTHTNNCPILGLNAAKNIYGMPARQYSLPQSGNCS